MAELLARLARRLAATTRVDGAVAVVTNGDPDLVEAFEELGWDDPHVEPQQDDTEVAPPADAADEAAVLDEPAEKAVQKRPKARGSR